MQTSKVLDMNAELLYEARRRLRRPVDNPKAPLNMKDFSQGSVEICPLCKYTSKKHPKGSAYVRGFRFKCFSCGESRRVE